MATKKKKKKVISRCENCNFKTEALIPRDGVELCQICYESMPGIYVVGDKGSTSLPATIMRQNAYCTNTILEALRRMQGGRS